MKYIFLLILSLTLISCAHKAQVLQTERVRTEWRDQIRLQRDSIYLHDSIHIERKGDTVYRERWRILWRDRLRHDTLYRYERDSIPYVVRVQNPLSGIDLWSVRLSKLALLVLALLVLVLSIYRLWIRR